MRDAYFHMLKGRLENHRIDLSELRRMEATRAAAKIRQAVSAKTGGLCFYCGAVGDVPDHFIPVVKGGSDHIDNLFPCCRSCNNSKKDHLLEDWRIARRMKVARENFGLPGFSVSQCRWLSEKASIDILQHIGVPEITFWFERMEITMPIGSTIDWSPSEGSLEWSRERIADRRRFEFSDFCAENDAKPKAVISKLKELGASSDVLSDLRAAA